MPSSLTRDLFAAIPPHGPLRSALWRAFGVPFPALPNWRVLVEEVSSVPVWIGQDGLTGAPLEWSLLEREPGSRRVRSVVARCATTGNLVAGATEAHHDLPVVWGVRCARCGVPLDVRVAGMRTSFDVPMCRPCAPAVRRAIVRR